MNYILQNLKDHVATSTMETEATLNMAKDSKDKETREWCKEELRKIDKHKEEVILEEREFRRQYWEQQFQLTK